MKTVFVDLHRAAATVYRVHTQSSTYLLGMHPMGARRSVVVRGEPGSDKANVIIRDSEPLIGGRSLWDVPHAEWVGHVLEIGTMITSRIRSVVEETDEQTISLVTSVGLAAPAAQRGEDGEELTVFRAPQAPPQPQRRARPDYPESHVEYAEEAATRLRLIQREGALFADVANDTLLRDRLAVALAGCAVALEGLRRQGAAR